MKTVNEMIKTDDLTPLLKYYNCTEDKIPWYAVSLYCNFGLTAKFKETYKDNINQTLLNKYQPVKVKATKKTNTCPYKISTDEFGEKYLTVSLQGNYHLYIPEDIELNDVTPELIDSLLDDTDVNSFGECVIKKLSVSSVIKK